MYSATGIEFIETLNLNEKKQKMAFSRTNSNNQGITNIHGFSKDGKIFVKEIHQNKSGKVYVKEYIQPEKNFVGSLTRSSLSHHAQIAHLLLPPPPLLPPVD